MNLETDDNRFYPASAGTLLATLVTNYADAAEQLPNAEVVRQGMSVLRVCQTL
jgi:hypothetical protein